ncbi:MAG: cupin domain-containing protein [Lentisphaeria bacterium]|nr:cupin domain-containing protein [Lentisphaeria bacterium]MBQ7393983.1 cupin domain-containing protein [Lentisphaeria bacterium]MBR2642454.1 cupin domain-containing protein [Lentisphaeria bacterium]
MIRKNGEYRTELRPEMRGGTGTVKIEHLLDEAGELRGLNRLFARLTLEPGTSIGFHEHVGEAEVFVVVSGTGEIDDNGVKGSVAAGDTILTGFGAGHGVTCTGNEPLVMLAVITQEAAR